MAQQDYASAHAVSEDQLEWVQVDHGKFSARIKRLSTAANCSQLGCRLVETPPGKSACPFHYHMAAEEVVDARAVIGSVPACFRVQVLDFALL